MNYPDNSTVNTTAKKIRFASATRALIVGLALLLPGAAALASDIPGVDIIVKKKPPKAGAPIINTRTEADGTFQFNGLAAGDYDLSVGGKLVHTLRVGSDGGIKGVLSRQPDGKASIAISGIIIAADNNAVAIDRDGRGDGKGEAPLPGYLPGKAAPKKASNPDPPPPPPPREVEWQPYSMGTAPPPAESGGGQSGISDQGAIGGLIAYATAPPPPPKSEDKELPGKRGGFIIPLIAVTTAQPPADLNGDGKLPRISGDVIPGIIIAMKKDGTQGPAGPVGSAVTLPSDASGKFSLQLKEPGNYTISTACRQPGGCLPHKLSGELKPGASGEPSIIAILIGLLLPAQKASADGTTFNFTVGDRGVVLSGQFQDAAGVRIAAGDITGDGRRVAPTVNSVNEAPGITGAMQEVPTTRGTAPGPGGTVGGGGTGIVPVGGAGGGQPTAQINSSGGTLAIEAIVGKQVQSGGSTDNNPTGSKVAANPGFEPPRSGFAGMGGSGPGILPGMVPGGPGPGPVGPSPGVMSPGGPAGPGGGAMRR